MVFFTAPRYPAAATNSATGAQSSAWCREVQGVWSKLPPRRYRMLRNEVVPCLASRLRWSSLKHEVVFFKAGSKAEKAHCSLTASEFVQKEISTMHLHQSSPTLSRFAVLGIVVLILAG